MSQVAHPIRRPILAGLRARRLLWSLLGLVVVTCVTLGLILAINPGHKSTTTASPAAPYTAGPDEGLGTVRSPDARYSARPDEGLAPIAKQSAPSGYSARPNEGLAPIQPSGGQ
jgi:hypothetical protein